MDLHDSFSYKQAKKKSKELHNLLTKLDKVGDILYDNLNYSGVWELAQHLEEVRIYYYVQYHEYNNIVKNKGKIDVKEQKR